MEKERQKNRIYPRVHRLHPLVFHPDRRVDTLHLKVWLPDPRVRDVHRRVEAATRGCGEPTGGCSGCTGRWKACTYGCGVSTCG